MRIHSPGFRPKAVVSRTLHSVPLEIEPHGQVDLKGHARGVWSPLSNQLGLQNIADSSWDDEARSDKADSRVGLSLLCSGFGLSRLGLPKRE
jgi:hypothetical protein